MSYEDACDRLAKTRARAAKAKSDREKIGSRLRVASLRGDPQEKMRLRKEFEAAEREEREAAEEFEVAEALHADAEARHKAAQDADRQKHRDANFLELIEAVRPAMSSYFRSWRMGCSGSSSPSTRRSAVARRMRLAGCAKASRAWISDSGRHSSRGFLSFRCSSRFGT